MSVPPKRADAPVQANRATRSIARVGPSCWTRPGLGVLAGSSRFVSIAIGTGSTGGRSVGGGAACQAARVRVSRGAVRMRGADVRGPVARWFAIGDPVSPLETSRRVWPYARWVPLGQADRKRSGARGVSRDGNLEAPWTGAVQSPKDGRNKGKACGGRRGLRRGIRSAQAQRTRGAAKTTPLGAVLVPDNQALRPVEPKATSCTDPGSRPWNRGCLRDRPGHARKGQRSGPRQRFGAGRRAGAATPRASGARAPRGAGPRPPRAAAGPMLHPLPDEAAPGAAGEGDEATAAPRRRRHTGRQAKLAVGRKAGRVVLSTVRAGNRWSSSLRPCGRGPQTDRAQGGDVAEWSKALPC